MNLLTTITINRELFDLNFQILKLWTSFRLWRQFDSVKKDTPTACMRNIEKRSWFMQASTNLWTLKQSTKTLNTPSKTLYVNNHANVQLYKPHLVSEYSRVDFANNPNKYSSVDSFNKGISDVHCFDGAYWRKDHFTTCKCGSARKSFNKTVAINLQGGNRKFFKTFKRNYSAPEKEQAPLG